MNEFLCILIDQMKMITDVDVSYLRDVSYVPPVTTLAPLACDPKCQKLTLWILQTFYEEKKRAKFENYFDDFIKSPN